MAETLLLIHLDEVLNPAHHLKNQHVFGNNTKRMILKRNALPVHGILETLEPWFQAHRLTRGIGNPELAATANPPPPCCPPWLGVRTHHQKMTVAARGMAERKTWAQQLQQIARRRQSFNREKRASIL